MTFSACVPRVTPRRSTTRPPRSAIAVWSTLGCAVTISVRSASCERPLQRLALQLELGQRGHVRVVVAQLGAERAQQRDDLQRGRLADVADAGLVADAEHRDPRALHRQPGVVEHALDLRDAVVGHLLVDLPRELDELGRHVELARAPAEVERVDRQAVPAHARAGLEAHEPVGLARRGLDDLPDVDPHAVGQHRELVHERDVHRAEDVLQELRQLRRLGTGDAHQLVAHQPVDLLRALRAGLRQPADDLRCVAQREVRAAGVDALRRERQLEVAPRRQPRRFEQRRDPLARRTRVGRRLQHDQLPRLQDIGQRARGVDQRPQIRLAVGRERRRHADQHRVGLRQPRVARGGVDPLGDLAQLFGGDILDVGVPRLDRLDLALVEIDRDHVAALPRERHRERQAHIAQPDDANGRHLGRQSMA